MLHAETLVFLEPLVLVLFDRDGTTEYLLPGGWGGIKYRYVFIKVIFVKKIIDK